MSLNTLNDKLTNEIPKPQDVKDILKDILLKTNNIHVSFLFTPVGHILLKKLALSLCSTNSLTPGWQELSLKLNLEPLLPKCVQNYDILNEDPLYHIIAAYTQIEEGTIGKVYQAIYDIQRYDTINYTKNYVNEFCEAMGKKYDIPQEKILKLEEIPDVPIIFKSEQNIRQKINIFSIMSSNPVNEKLNEIPKPQDVKDILKDILLKTNNIHVSFLFTPVGHILLNKLALSLCSTNSLTSGWQELSLKLNLEPLLPKCIQNYNILNQDPLYHVLAAYTQIEEGTIGKVYQAIYDIQRYDTINYTKSYVNEFCEAMCKKYGIPQEKILKPTKIPDVPIIFKSEQNISQKINIFSIMSSNPVNEKLKNEIPKPPEVKDILKDILLKTNNIHVSFLFVPVGELLLQKLALCLCSTNSSSTNGWQDLSHTLNLGPLIPKCIQNYNILKQDPLYHILLAYTQRLVV